MKNEPVITAVSIGAIISALLSLLVSFGLNVSDDQIQAILQFASLVVPLVLAAVYARARVTPVDKARRRKRRPNDRRPGQDARGPQAFN